MKVTYMLFLLTTAPSGELSSAYSNYTDKEECEGALAAVSSVFDAQDVETAYRGCLKSEQSLTPFEHQVDPTAKQYVVLNTISDDTLTVSFEESRNSCEAKLSSLDSSTKSWCTITHQSLEQ
ncbi:hypothetical protein [Cohaesibacter gelatinilyticus]|uniref:Uncharacterized protein n=1 Tax=Cohaesibacter gelatinilyticus TaxID=372072 RepID=A0A285PFU8_9HYPH|nr:hypothetical protein [Cohaesibacter gelatinilyticus]SNZ20600.1 hypothetical protein SAMN06265368_3706 [Cohaesibacter gelatinilyticus]